MITVITVITDKGDRIGRIKRSRLEPGERTINYTASLHRLGEWAGRTTGVSKDEHGHATKIVANSVVANILYAHDVTAANSARQLRRLTLRRVNGHVLVSKLW